MKYWIDADEVYPVFSIKNAKDGLPYDEVVEVPDELVERYNRICKEYAEVQKEIAKLARYYEDI